MIDRYSTPQMKEIWSDENKFSSYLKVEIAFLKTLSKLKIVPDADVKKIASKLKINLKRIFEIEQETKHDVIAFTRSLSEQLGVEKKWVHYGLTSNDVVDTAYSLQLKQANQIIAKKLENFISILKKQSLKYKKTPCIGRTHGIHAEITFFGLKFLNWYDEMTRNLKRFSNASEQIILGKFSGAVGNHSSTSLKAQDLTCKELGLNNPKISTQVLSRDIHIEYINSLTMIATTIEKIAIEVRSLQRTEIGEVQENFSTNQKGSSAMPHKKNPIASENMCGIARVMRGYLMSTYENNALWHERDISHSSSERIIIPDSTNLVDYILTRYASVIENLIVHEDKMIENINLTKGVIFSQRVLNELINKKMSREEAYDLVQKIAMDSFNNKLDFKKLVIENNTISKLLTSKEINLLFNYDFYYKEVENLYKRVFK